MRGILYTKQINLNDGRHLWRRPFGVVILYFFIFSNVEIRFLRISFYLATPNYEQISPLEVPSYDFGRNLPVLHPNLSGLCDGRHLLLTTKGLFVLNSPFAFMFLFFLWVYKIPPIQIATLKTVDKYLCGCKICCNRDIMHITKPKQ